MSADSKLKAYIDRVLHSREREDAEKANTKEIYAELAGEGYDKTIVGKVVNHLRKDQDKVREQSELFDTYLISYLGASHVHARVREADSSTAARMDAPNPNATGQSALNAGEVGTQAPPVEIPERLVVTPADPLWSEAAEGNGAVTVAQEPIPEPETAPPGVSEAGDRGAVTPPAAATVVPADRSKPHPWCKDPEDCGVEASWNHMCLSCHRRMEKALTERSSAVLH
jgi:uncharacterized protein (UPF0335 family)